MGGKYLWRIYKAPKAERYGSRGFDKPTTIWYTTIIMENENKQENQIIGTGWVDSAAIAYKFLNEIAKKESATTLEVAMVDYIRALHQELYRLQETVKNMDELFRNYRIWHKYK